MRTITMNDATFPSGQWIGFYTYASEQRRYLMDLVLEFRDGVIAGEGADGIGFFAIDGSFDPRAGECAWYKTYLGRHTVEYTGYREKKGIWGTWHLDETRGGFHIWPVGEGLPLATLREEVVEEFPLRPVHAGVPLPSR